MSHKLNAQDWMDEYFSALTRERELREALESCIRGFELAKARDPEQAGMWNAYAENARAAIAKATE